MCTLLLVDDEADIRNGLANTINWGQCGISHVSTAGNGIEALEIMKHSNVDVVLMDIKMPGMDGLTLAREIRHADYKTEILILSGFAEFEFAQRAMTYGVRGYVLKPVDIDECMRLVSSAVAVCREKQSLDQLAHGRRQTDLVLCEHQLRDAMLGRLILDRNQEADGVAAILLDAYHVVCVAIYEMECTTLDMRKVKKRVEKCISQEMVIITGETMLSILFSKSKSVKELRFLLEELFIGLELENGVQIRIGVSDALCPISALAEGYSQAVQALEMSYFSPEQRYFLRQDALGRMCEKQPTDILYEKAHLPATNLEPLFSQLRKSGGTQNQVREYLRKYFVGMQHYCTSEFIEQRVALQLEQTEHQLRHSWNLDMDKQALQKLMEAISAAENTEQGAGKNVLVDRIKRYIQTHYTKDIDLFTVSEAMMKNSNYLSHLFSDVCGMTFSEYLNAVRIKQSKQILMETEDTVYAVARQVGYNSERYFATKFKESTGLTPTQFRNRK